MAEGPAGVPPSLAEYLSAESLQPLLRRLRDRLERTGLRAQGAIVVELDEDGASRLGGLIGGAPQPGRVRVHLDVLDQALRASAAAAGLVAVLGELGGPLVDRREVRQEQQEARAGVWRRLDELLAAAGLASAAWVPEFVESVRRSGALTRAGTAVAVNALEESVAVLRELAPGTALACGASAGPVVVEPRWELAELASRRTGDAHGLDDGRLKGALVLRAVAAAAGQPAPSAAAERRELWELVGVTSDVVSGTVLVWALRPAGGSRWAAMMRERFDQQLVTHLTVQELRTVPAIDAGGRRVFGCENPQVLQAAARAGVTTPLVCFAGNPAFAGLLLLQLLVDAGTPVSYHGDFDWPGVAIAGRLFARGASPWRMGAADYADALAVLPPESRLALSGEVQSTPWDPELAAEMARCAVAAHEESLLPTLLEDLAGDSSEPLSTS